MHLWVGCSGKKTARNLVEGEKADAASKITSKGQTKRASAADSRVVSLETELSIVKAAHTC